LRISPTKSELLNSECWFRVAIVLKKLFQLLNRDLTGRTWHEEADHPYFGNMVLFAFKNRPESYWESELLCEGVAVSLCIEAPDRMPPSDGQVAFAKSILGDLDRAFAMATPVLVMEYEARSERKVPSRRREAFRFEGLTVPVGGDDRNSWDVSF